MCFLVVVFSLQVQLSTQGHSEEVFAAQARGESRGDPLDQIIILTNSLSVICVIEGKEDWILRRCLVDILDKGKSFVSIRFQYFSRDWNIAAHALAKFCSKFDVDSEFFGNFPNWIGR